MLADLGNATAALPAAVISITSVASPTPPVTLKSSPPAPSASSCVGNPPSPAPAPTPAEPSFCCPLSSLALSSKLSITSTTLAPDSALKDVFLANDLCSIPPEHACSACDAHVSTDKDEGRMQGLIHESPWEGTLTLTAHERNQVGVGEPGTQSVLMPRSSPSGSYPQHYDSSLPPQHYDSSLTVWVVSFLVSSVLGHRALQRLLSPLLVQFRKVPDEDRHGKRQDNDTLLRATCTINAEHASVNMQMSARGRLSERTCLHCWDDGFGTLCKCSLVRTGTL